ncbi:MAG: C1 family peptidase [Ignavibacteria bacterium]|nr:C1 family peptidase [Ignavibacteria bacterium]
MRRIASLLLLCCLFSVLLTPAASRAQGALTPELLQELRGTVTKDAATKTIMNAVSANSAKALVLDRETVLDANQHFSHKIKTEGITDQKSSGRCWLFAGLNILRPVAGSSLNKKGFEFSQNYLAFYDKIEKANLFLESIIQTRARPLDDRDVDWLIKNSLPDGGQWNMVLSLVDKYGVVPSDVMPETESSGNTGLMNGMISTVLHRHAIALRGMGAQGMSEAEIRAAKSSMLKEVYRMLVIHLGMPPESFTWRYEDKDGKVTEPATYTPKEFYRKFVNVRLEDYVCLYSVPTHAFNTLYQIRYDRNLVDAPNMTFANVPIETMKKLTLASVLGDEPVWFGCDVGKESDSKLGLMKRGLYDYESLYGVSMKLSKKDRVLYQESVPSHAMVFVGVDVINGKPEKWLVENSWGTKAGNNGLFTMYDSWFDEYMYAVIINRKHLSKDILDMFTQTPEVLPPWDPMFAFER